MIMNFSGKNIARYDQNHVFSAEWLAKLHFQTFIKNPLRICFCSLAR
jgi:hypothetical protein